MHYEGVIRSPLPRKEFYAFVSNPARVISVIPDVEESRVQDQDHFTVKTRVGLGPIRGTMDFQFETVEKNQDFSVALKGRGQGMQGSVEVKLAISFEDVNGETLARWKADAAVGGLLAGVAGRLIERAAERYVKQITEALQESTRGSDIRP